MNRRQSHLLVKAARFYYSYEILQAKKPISQEDFIERLNLTNKEGELIKKGTYARYENQRNSLAVSPDNKAKIEAAIGIPLDDSALQVYPLEKPKDAVVKIDKKRLERIQHVTKRLLEKDVFDAETGFNFTMASLGAKLKVGKATSPSSSVNNMKLGNASFKLATTGLFDLRVKLEGQTGLFRVNPDYVLLQDELEGGDQIFCPAIPKGSKSYTKHQLSDFILSKLD